MKYLLGLFLVMLSGCSVLQDAKKAFDDDIDGFKQDFARVYLKENK